VNRGDPESGRHPPDVRSGITFPSVRPRATVLASVRGFQLPWQDRGTLIARQRRIIASRGFTVPRRQWRVRGDCRTPHCWTRWTWRRHMVRCARPRPQCRCVPAHLLRAIRRGHDLDGNEELRRSESCGIHALLSDDLPRPGRLHGRLMDGSRQQLRRAPSALGRGGKSAATGCRPNKAQLGSGALPRGRRNFRAPDHRRPRGPGRGQTRRVVQRHQTRRRMLSDSSRAAPALAFPANKSRLAGARLFRKSRDKHRTRFHPRTHDNTSAKMGITTNPHALVSLMRANARHLLVFCPADTAEPPRLRSLSAWSSATRTPSARRAPLEGDFDCAVAGQAASSCSA